jgi:cobalamin biosynthesis Mg chelatase CobN
MLLHCLMLMYIGTLYLYLQTAMSEFDSHLQQHDYTAYLEHLQQHGTTSNSSTTSTPNSNRGVQRSIQRPSGASPAMSSARTSAHTSPEKAVIAPKASSSQPRTTAATTVNSEPAATVTDSAVDSVDSLELQQQQQQQQSEKAVKEKKHSSRKHKSSGSSSSKHRRDSSSKKQSTSAIKVSLSIVYCIPTSACRSVLVMMIIYCCIMHRCTMCNARSLVSGSGSR